MTQKTRLYLLGGSPAYSSYADDFVAASGGINAKIAVLVQTHTGWEKHKKEIITPWQKRGIIHYNLIAPDEAGILNTQKAIAILKSTTGIFISGGHTPTYHSLYTSQPLRSIIREQYNKGIPVAGVSAGALISMEKCQLITDEPNEEYPKIVDGLGLANDFVIGVHFTENQALPLLLDIMKATRTNIGIGIDEPAYVVCENGKITKALGKSVHRIEMLDFQNTIYKKTIL